MLPTIAGGDFVIARRYFFTPKLNDIVVVDHPIYGRIVKRIEKIAANHTVWLRGENDDSVKPEQMGWISPDAIKGKVIYTVSQLSKL